MFHYNNVTKRLSVINVYYTNYTYIYYKYQSDDTEKKR